jgi:Flp pilus assembly protein TadD
MCAGIQDGKALFTRATEMTRGLVLEPPTQRLEPSDRRRLEESRALLLEAKARKATFATEWFLGKTELRLGNFAQAAEALVRASAIDPEQPDAPRELANAYLELERNADALEAAERALALKPGDATLRCNLAFVLLLTGDLERARNEAKLANQADPKDSVTLNVLKLIDAVASGKRKRPETVAEAEGRKR